MGNHQFIQTQLLFYNLMWNLIKDMVSQPENYKSLVHKLDIFEIVISKGLDKEWALV